MESLKPGTTVYIKHKGIYYPRFLVGFNSNGEPIIESTKPNGITKFYMSIPERRLFTAEDVDGRTDGPQ